MRRILTRLCLALIAVALSPHLVAAGGNEFPASGTRNLGRGGSGLTRVDDPTVMLRNPALLADMWDDMAYTGALIEDPRSCFQASGSLRWNAVPNDNVRLGGPNGQQLLVSAPSGAKAADGTPLPNLLDEPYPKVCYQGPIPVLPTVALAMKLASNLGVGLGFFPPDIGALNQFGNRDGTVNTPNGLRPSPTRWFGATLNTSYFSALGAIGWRPANWISIGFGFQWQLVAYSATTFSMFDRSRGVGNDVRTDVFGRDLFVPGLIGSAQITPIDNFDIAIGYKWSDRVKSKVKLDVLTGAFGSGQPFSYINASGDAQNVGGNIPTPANNLIGSVNAPPIWSPQLSFGLRYADRLTPRVPLAKWDAAHKAAGRDVEDHMATERWDIEADGIVYFNGVNDVSKFTNNGQQVNAQAVNAMGVPGSNLAAYVGECVGGMVTANCKREIPTFLHGNTQFSLRFGGDYNILPGMLAVRAGVSYETDGQDVSYLNPENYQLGRTGIHVGATLRVAKKTDISIAYAHFIQRDVSLTLGSTPAAIASTGFPNTDSMDPAKYHVVQGKGDGVAKFAIADANDVGEGPLKANAGTYYYHLDVFSVSLAQHF